MTTGKFGNSATVQIYFTCTDFDDGFQTEAPERTDYGKLPLVPRQTDTLVHVLQIKRQLR
jgi:hypothetical protein